MTLTSEKDLHTFRLKKSNTEGKMSNITNLMNKCLISNVKAILHKMYITKILPRKCLRGSHIVGFSPSKLKENSQRVKTHVNYADIGGPDYRPLHQISDMCLSKGYLVVYGAESAQDETAKDRLIGNIENAGALKEPWDNISNGLLTIFDRDWIYEQCGRNHDSIVKFWNSNVKRANARHQILSKGTMLFSAPDTYFLNKAQDTFFLGLKGQSERLSLRTSA
jgi:hypothetical protein